MTLKRDQILTYFLVVLCAFTIIRSVMYIDAQYRWSPIDEFAHMDYVDKVSEGTLPKVSDTISDELFQSVIKDTLRSFLHNIHSRQALGLGDFSYESHHPPVYYFVLAVPERIMKKWNWDIIKRLKVLRLCSYFIFAAGMFLCIPLFRSLNKLGFNIPLSYAWGCVLFGLAIVTNRRYGLGNNMMSPLMINSCAYFLIQYYGKPSQRNLYLMITFCCLSVFTAFSNIFIVPLLFLFLLKKYRSNFSWKSFSISLLIIITSVLLLFYWRKATAPNPLIANFIYTAFAGIVPAGQMKYGIFWQLLSEDMLTLTFIKDNLNMTYVMLALFIVSNGICLLYLKNVFKKNAWLLCFGMLFFTFMLCTFFLNKYVGAIYWDAFRHYLGFIPVIYVACTAFIPVLYSKYRNS
ncbi:MAG: family glycosyltransferase, 4-amino-4-deoxy-L-arabinose transferase [Bacteroidetes bacterium]|nr:family glycosyltransferase, 4-amino-4-deoxy-L-arabinose transferase [Bacteroidota bacterium]